MTLIILQQSKHSITRLEVRYPMSELSLSDYLYWEAVLKDEQVELVKACDNCGRVFLGLVDEICGGCEWEALPTARWMVCPVCQNGQLVNENQMERDLARCDKCARLCCLDCVAADLGYDVLCDGCYEWRTFE